MQILTDQEIREDIAEFQARISEARRKLELLPAGYLPFKEHKKREKVRRELLGEIIQVEGLIKIAREALL